MMNFFHLVTSIFDGVCRRSVEWAKLNDLSGWLTVLPTSQYHFDLTAQEFGDALALRYQKPLLMFLLVVIVVVLPSHLTMPLFVEKVA